MGRMLCSGILVAMTVLPGGAGEKLIVKVSPEVSWAPARVIVRATVERDTDNRALNIVAESDEFYRSSTVPLDGERATMTTVVQFDGLPRGDYRIITRLLGPADKVRAAVSRALTVAAGPPGEDPELRP